MKKVVGLVLSAAVLCGVAGCSYAGVAGVGADKVVIARNDGFLFGILRKVYVCRVTDAGVTACQSDEAP
jgi:hypothetical protein